jgi:hypothetical protein
MDILDNNDKLDESLKSRSERLNKFIDEGLAKMKWSNGCLVGFQESEVEDLCWDLKEHFEDSEFYAEDKAHNIPYDDWYDYFVDEELRPILEERQKQLKRSGE